MHAHTSPVIEALVYPKGRTGPHIPPDRHKRSSFTYLMLAYSDLTLRTYVRLYLHRISYQLRIFCKCYDPVHQNTYVRTLSMVLNYLVYGISMFIQYSVALLAEDCLLLPTSGGVPHPLHKELIHCSPLSSLFPSYR